MLRTLRYQDVLTKILNSWEDFIPAKEGTLIGGLIFLKDWIIRSEVSDALSKIYVRNIKTNKEEELKITEEKVISPGISLRTKRQRYKYYKNRL